MPEDVKWKVLDHAYLADADPDETMSMSFTFISDAGDDPPWASVVYGCGKHRK